MKKPRSTPSSADTLLQLHEPNTLQGQVSSREQWACGPELSYWLVHDVPRAYLSLACCPCARRANSLLPGRHPGNAVHLTPISKAEVKKDRVFISWHMPALFDIFGDGACLQFGGGTLGHPWGNTPGAVANRVALEACVLARNSGVELSKRGADIIREACRFSPELAAAAEVWQSIEFNYEAVDTVDR